MKTTNIVNMAIVATLLGCNPVSIAQVTATAAASVSIIEPIGLAKNADMDFGNAAVSASTGGTIVLSPTGSRTVGGSGVTLPATAGTIAAAGFTVSGRPGYTFAITLPGSAIIYGPGTASLTVNGFMSVPSVTGTLGSGGTQPLHIGATLNIPASQPPGNYTNATAIRVTVNYN